MVLENVSGATVAGQHPIAQSVQRNGATGGGSFSPPNPTGGDSSTVTSPGSTTNSRVPDTTERPASTDQQTNEPLQSQRTSLELQTRKLRLAGLQNRLNQLLNSSEQQISNETNAPSPDVQTSASNETDAPSGTVSSNPETNQTDSSEGTPPDLTINQAPASNTSPSTSQDSQSQLQERLQFIDQEINEIQFKQLQSLLRDATEPVSRAEGVTQASEEAEDILDPGADLQDISEQESTTLPTSIPLSPGQVVNTRG